MNRKPNTFLAGLGSTQLSLARSVSWNYLGYFVEFGSGLLLLAYVVRQVSVGDYGIYLLAQSLAAFLLLLDLGLTNIMIPLYVSAFARKGITEVNTVAGTFVALLLILGAAGTIGLSLIALLMPQLIRLPAAQTALIVRVLVISSAAVALSLPQIALEQLCRAFHHFDRVNQVQIAAALARIILTVAALTAGMGIVGLAWVQVAVSLLRMGALWFATSAGISGCTVRFCFDVGLLREAMQLSRWSLADDISRRIGMNTEPVILAWLASFRQVAIFGMSAKLPAHLVQFSMRGLTVLIPTLSQFHAKGNTAHLRTTYISALRVTLTIFIPLTTFGVICSRALMRTWAGPDYSAAGPVLAWLLVSALSMVIMFPSDLVLYSHKHVKLAAALAVIETVGKIGVALVLAGRYGAVGVAAGVALWHWTVNLCCYVPSACRVAGMHPWKLWGAVLRGYTGPDGEQKQSWRRGDLLQLNVYLACAFALAAGMRYLTPQVMFVACGVVSLIYIAVWLNCTGLPMWRGDNRLAVEMQ